MNFFRVFSLNGNFLDFVFILNEMLHMFLFLILFGRFSRIFNIFQNYVFVDEDFLSRARTTILGINFLCMALFMPSLPTKTKYVEYFSRAALN